jgi:lipoate---protein ligase
MMVVTRRGSPVALHAAGMPTAADLGRGLRAEWCDPDRPGLILGSAQRDDVVDAERCAFRQVEVGRRRSGGGAVLIVPEQMLWLDVLIGRDHPLWLDDVGRSMWWLGEVWAGALTSCGVDGATVYRDRPNQTAWSRLVCFDGIGAGEVMVNGRKAVGISQRRTRDAARLQSSIHLVWQPDLLVELLSPPRPTAIDLSAPYVFTGDPAQLRAAVEHQVHLHLG